MTDYSAYDIHRLDQAYPDAVADIEEFIGNPVHQRRLAEVGPEVFAAEQTRDLAFSIDSPMFLAGWAAIATVRLMEAGKAWEEDTEMAFDQRDAARAMADELRAELDRVRANRDQVADSLSAVWDALGLKTASDGNAVDAIHKLTAELDRVRAQLTAANHHTDGLAADVRDMQKANTAYANENARLRSKLAEADEVIDSMRAAIDEADKAEVAR